MKKIKTRNLKVLPLEGWMLYTDEEDIKELNLKEAVPIFKRPGYYLFNNFCWFELPSGKAYNYDVATFKFELSLYEVSKYNNKQIEALKEIINQKLATKKQKELYYLIRHYYQSKDVERSAMRIRIKYK